MHIISQLDGSLHKSLFPARVEDIFGTKLYYIYRGRNAWHSTWVENYTDGCMHDNMQSAMGRVEEMRERGSVFVIREQPALVFRTAKGQLILTEINCLNPFSLWSGMRKTRGSEYLLNRNNCRLEHIISPNTKVKSVIESLSDRAIFPTYRPSTSPNLFTLATTNARLCGEQRLNNLKQWKSASEGSQDYLDWFQQPNSISSKSAQKVARALNLALRRNGVSI